MAPDLPIYLDHHATTPTDPRVVEAMQPYWSERFGNASSATHRYGWMAEAAVEDARERIAGAIGAASPAEIVFTSGTTESDNLALKGVARASRGRGNHLVTSAIEHPAVADTCQALVREGFEVTVVPVDGDGLVDPADVVRALRDDTLLVSIMAANSEIGTLQPLEEIGRLCRERGVWLHSDAAQAVGRVPVDVRELPVDLLSFCAHKLYGPKGVGALWVRGTRPRIRLEPLLHGGGHERGRRSGTLPVPLVVGFARALELCLADLPAESARLASLRDHLWDGLSRQLEGVHRNGHPTRRLPGNLNVSFEGVEADALLLALPDVALSSGSACASHRGEPSPVLRALGLSESRARSALRFGLGRSNTVAQVDRVVGRLVEEVGVLRARGSAALRLGRGH